jgi:tRNA threonylcarbamoyladenosine biosynthesis protein TsaE
MSAINLPSPEATYHFGQGLSSYVRLGDTMLIDGPLGAGKTTLSQGVLSPLLRADETVVSPTFSLVQQYDITTADGQRGYCTHADLYRLSSPKEMDEIGLEDALGRDFCIIEWPSRLAAGLPKSYIYCGIESDNTGQGRSLTLRMVGMPSRPALSAWLVAQHAT